jgi:hypothetical protein
MAAVMIGVDPHKGSHTAVVIDQAEMALGQVTVRACAGQAERLLAWAAAWPERTWAVEGAGGLGHLLDWQLVAAGEPVPGRAAQAGRAGPAAGRRRCEQERPERRPVGRRGGAAVGGLPAGAGR